MCSGNLHRTIGQIYTEWNRDIVCFLGNNLEVLQINYFYYVCSKLERAISPDSRECMWQVSPATSTPTAVVGFKVQTYFQHCHQFLTPTQNYKTACITNYIQHPHPFGSTVHLRQVVPRQLQMTCQLCLWQVDKQLKTDPYTSWTLTSSPHRTVLHNSYGVQQHDECMILLTCELQQELKHFAHLAVLKSVHRKCLLPQIVGEMVAKQRNKLMPDATLSLLNWGI